MSQQPPVPPVVKPEEFTESAPTPDQVEATDDVIVIQDTPVIDATKLSESPPAEG